MNDLIIDREIRKLQIENSKKIIKKSAIIVAKKMARLERRMITQGEPRRKINLACIQICESYEEKCKKEIIKENFLTGVAGQIMPGVGDYFKRVFLEYLLNQLGVPPSSDLGLGVLEALKNIKYSKFMEYFQSGNCPMVTDLICDTISDFALTKLAEYVQDSMRLASTSGTTVTFSEKIGGFLTSSLIPPYLQDFIKNSRAGNINAGSAIFEILKSQVKINLLPGLKKEVAKLICGQDMQSFAKHITAAAEKGSSKIAIEKENTASVKQTKPKIEKDLQNKSAIGDEYSDFRSRYLAKYGNKEVN